MDFTLSGESKMMVKAARDLAKQEIEQIEAKIEEENAIPDDIWQKFAKARMLGMMIPKEYGGIGSSALNVILILEELAKTGSAVASVMDPYGQLWHLLNQALGQIQRRLPRVLNQMEIIMY
jgi:alkylation response protein AidB-like acyl-CoA dehydrogenase